ncbi:hypothetical protein BDV12DRAFT_181589 [Aspergillus spectabilis]
MTSPSGTILTTATTVACLNCRDKHLKCDGNPSGCGRCRSLSLACHFVPSRRGRRGRPADFSCFDTCFLPPTGITRTGQTPPYVDASLPLIGPSDVPTPSWPDPPRTAPQMNVHLIKVFFEYFHPAHPILPPFDLWAASSPPQYLISTIELIGLHHLSPCQVPDYPSDLWAAIGNADLALEKAQSYLLLSILSHGQKSPDSARKCIGSAIECAYTLGLHCRDLSDTVEPHDPARAESMRRTLWEIFVVDTLLTAVQVGGSLQYNMETPDVALPSEDDKFVLGHSVASTVFARDLGMHALYADGRLSSLAYRVEATLILRQCLAACETHACEDTVEVLDSAISAWFLRWPHDKSAILQPDGKVNQTDIQSAMIMHCATIYLHFPRSLLVSFLPTTREVFCLRPPQPFPSPSTTTNNPQMHTAKIVHAATALSKLASLSTVVTGHSPFFACTLVLSSLVQVTILSGPALGIPPGKHVAHLALNLAVLRSMGSIWGISASASDALRAISREVEAASNESVDELMRPLSRATVP